MTDDYEPDFESMAEDRRAAISGAPQNARDYGIWVERLADKAERRKKADREWSVAMQRRARGQG